MMTSLSACSSPKELFSWDEITPATNVVDLTEKTQSIDIGKWSENLWWEMLVGGLDHFYFSIQLGRNWRTHMFQRGRYTTNQNIILPSLTI